MSNLLTVKNTLPAFAKSYLDKYGLTGWTAEVASPRKYDNIVVIPAIQEYENIKKLLLSLNQIDKRYIGNTLFLFVVNNSENAGEDTINDNFGLLKYLRGLIEDSNLNLAVVDACTNGCALPQKDAGVGLARKIGMDLSLTLFDYENKYPKIIICLDADCTVDKNYLSAIVEEFRNGKLKAGHASYEHDLPEDEIEKNAIVCYEIFLRYYTLGLMYANSPFAFSAIGSTMFCDAESYCRIGGMNKRKAAEDFYFLEKLAKITEIKKVKDAVVRPASRKSWRVPFGTGQRINRFIAATHDEYLLYNPEIFVVLKKWIEIFNSEDKTAEGLIAAASEISSGIKLFLEINSFNEQWSKILVNSKSKAQVQKQKIIWFDGFKTLKLVHYLRDNEYPQVKMFDALDRIFQLANIPCEIKRDSEIPSLEIQVEYLKLLREHT